MCGRVACTSEGCEKRVLCSCNFLISCYSNETIAFELKVFGKILFVGIFDPVRGRVACTSKGCGKRVSSILSVFFFGELLVQS